MDYILKSRNVELNDDIKDYVEKKIKARVEKFDDKIVKIEIEFSDLLFIDTDHTYDCVKKELTLHGNKIKKYIIMHDTTTYGYTGGDGGIGMWKAIEEFLELNTNWSIHKRYTNNNGLTILKRNK